MSSTSILGTTTVKKIPPKKGMSGGQKILIGIVVVCILAGIAVGIYFIIAGKDKPVDGDTNGDLTECSGTPPECISPSGSSIEAQCDGVNWKCPSGSCNLTDQFTCEDSEGGESESKCQSDGTFACADDYCEQSDKPNCADANGDPIQALCNNNSWTCPEETCKEEAPCVGGDKECVDGVWKCYCDGKEQNTAEANACNGANGVYQCQNGQWECLCKSSASNSSDKGKCEKVNAQYVCNDVSGEWECMCGTDPLGEGCPQGYHTSCVSNSWQCTCGSSTEPIGNSFCITKNDANDSATVGDPICDNGSYACEGIGPCPESGSCTSKMPMPYCYTWDETSTIPGAPEGSEPGYYKPSCPVCDEGAEGGPRWTCKDYFYWGTKRIPANVGIWVDGYDRNSRREVSESNTPTNDGYWLGYYGLNRNFDTYDANYGMLAFNQSGNIDFPGEGCLQNSTGGFAIRTTSTGDASIIQAPDPWAGAVSGYRIVSSDNNPYYYRVNERSVSQICSGQGQPFNYLLTDSDDIGESPYMFTKYYGVTSVEDCEKLCSDQDYSISPNSTCTETKGKGCFAYTHFNNNTCYIYFTDSSSFDGNPNDSGGTQYYVCSDKPRFLRNLDESFNTQERRTNSV
jgi:hypothetical protein